MHIRSHFSEIALFLIKIEDIHKVQQFKCFYKLTHKDLPEYFNANSLIQVGDIHDYITRNRKKNYTQGFTINSLNKVLDTVFFTIYDIITRWCHMHS